MYDDGLVAVAGDELVIRRYYFPWAGAKHIPLSKIRELRCKALPHGSARIWGSGDLVHWANLDSTRLGKNLALIIDLGHIIKPVITPDDPANFVEEMKTHGITITGDIPAGSP